MRSLSRHSFCLSVPADCTGIVFVQVSIHLDFPQEHSVTGSGDPDMDPAGLFRGSPDQRILFGKGILQLADFLMADTGSLIQGIVFSPGEVPGDLKAFHPLPPG